MTSSIRRALFFANLFNLLVAVYFIIIAIVSLVYLRWYHQLTISIKVRHIITSSTSYSAFLILIVESLVLVVTFLASGSGSFSKKYIRNNAPKQEAVNLTTVSSAGNNNEDGSQQTEPKLRMDTPTTAASSTHRKLTFNKQTSLSEPKGSHLCCSVFLQLLSSALLIVILVVWLLNTGELVRDSISAQLEAAFAKYQFANRTNHYSVAVDGMQDINYCCGSLDYTDFPHQRISGLSSGHYPGSCCGKHIFGVNARVLCVPEEIMRAKQTTGCVHVLSNFYDLISLLVVPAALVCLFVSITLTALITISRAHNLQVQEAAALEAALMRGTSERLSRVPNPSFGYQS